MKKKVLFNLAAVLAAVVGTYAISKRQNDNTKNQESEIDHIHEYLLKNGQLSRSDKEKAVYDVDARISSVIGMDTESMNIKRWEYQLEGLKYFMVAVDAEKSPYEVGDMLHLTVGISKDCVEINISENYL